MLRFTIFFGLSLLLQTQAFALSCHIRNSKMVVNNQGRFYSQNIESDQYSDCYTSNEVAALYDGRSFVIFNARQGRFASRWVRTNATNYQIVVDQGLAALHDGDDLYIFKANFHRLYRFMVNSNNQSLLRIGHGFVAYANKEQLQIFDSRFSNLKSTFVHKRYMAMAIGPKGVLFYDGQTVHGYCKNGNRFTRESVRQDGPTIATDGSFTTNATIEIAGTLYAFANYNCKIQTF